MDSSPLRDFVVALFLTPSEHDVHVAFLKRSILFSAKHGRLLLFSPRVYSAFAFMSCRDQWILKPCMYLLTQRDKLLWVIEQPAALKNHRRIELT
jgi:hypothetical protein